MNHHDQVVCVLKIFGFSILFITIWTSYLIFFFPNHPKFHVDDISLTRFTLSSTNNLSVNMTFSTPPETLYYNLGVNMTFQNPNSLIGIGFDKIVANATYHGHRFATVEAIQGYYLGYKMENDVSTEFKGQQLLALSDADKIEYDSENKDDHVYKIDLTLRFKMKYNLFWETKESYKVECHLKVPLSKVSSAKFERTGCDLNYL